MAKRLKRITLQVEGSAEDKGHVRLPEFIRRLSLLRNALAVTERQITGQERASVYWRIVDLKHDSPATVVLEEVPLPVSKNAPRPVAPAVGENLVRTMGKINRSPRRLPHEQQDLAILEAYKELGDVADRHIQKLVLKVGRSTVSIKPSFKTNIDRIIGPDQLEAGAISGPIEALNIHNALKFVVYPLVGPRKVSCEFPAHLKRDVLAAIGHYVQVEGTLRYKQWASFPHAMDATNLHVLPDDSSLPTLADLKGIAPNVTEGVASEDFVEALRDAW